MLPNSGAVTSPVAGARYKQGQCYIRRLLLGAHGSEKLNAHPWNLLFRQINQARTANGTANPQSSQNSPLINRSVAAWLRWSLRLLGQDVPDHLVLTAHELGYGTSGVAVSP